MTEETKKLLLECKKAGYERVTIFVADKRVPDSVRIRKGSTGWNADEDGMFKIDGIMKFVPKEGYSGSYWGRRPLDLYSKIICGAPDISGDCPGLPTHKTDGTSHTWPAMWGIIKNSEFVRGGYGSGNSHQVDCCGTLDPGYYDLSEIEAA